MQRALGLIAVVLLGVGLGRLSAAEPVFPAGNWSGGQPAAGSLDPKLLEEARDYALTGGGSGIIVHEGHAVLIWGDQRKRYDLKSTTKSLGATLLGVALLDGKVKLDDPVVKHDPAFGVPPESNRTTGWISGITIRHLATQCAGFEKPGGYEKLVFEPGTKWQYSDGGPNWLAECLTLAYRQDLDTVMFERVLTPIGVTRDDFVWRKNAYRPHEIEGIPRREFGSGVSANVDCLSRIGYLYLRGGKWRDKRILPADFVAEAGSAASSIRGLPVTQPDQYGHAPDHYGLLWWNNADGTLDEVPRDAFWSWGLYDSLIVVIPSLDLVVARAGQSWKRDPKADHYDVLRPFLTPIVAACRHRLPSGTSAPQDRASSVSSVRQPSPVIAGIEWAPPETIVRLAKGSDNWPLTWGGDDLLYTAYGDGRGFEPFAPKKLSLGLARLSGSPPDIRGENIIAPTAEAIGDGKSARKASGLLMLDDGTLYMLVRNVKSSQLGWSHDLGRTWEWADWKFGTSFGCPTFLNFGRAYAGARDEYVYIYSHDGDSAYERADRMVLARAPKRRLRERDAFEFFAGREASGAPTWSSDIARRGAVFENPGRCYRSSVVYNAPLKRYLWCQTGAGEDTRFAGGLAIYDAPEPWGPWTTAFQTDQWDVGPGETSSFPAKWISGDGCTLHLVFSGDDCFSVRKATLRLKE